MIARFVDAEADDIDSEPEREPASVDSASPCGGPAAAALDVEIEEEDGRVTVTVRGGEQEKVMMRAGIAARSRTRRFVAGGTELSVVSAEPFIAVGYVAAGASAEVVAALRRTFVH
jgi:hypothetical protein